MSDDAGAPPTRTIVRRHPSSIDDIRCDGRLPSEGGGGSGAVGSHYMAIESNAASAAAAAAIDSGNWEQRLMPASIL